MEKNIRIPFRIQLRRAAEADSVLPSLRAGAYVAVLRRSKCARFLHHGIYAGQDCVIELVAGSDAIDVNVSCGSRNGSVVAAQVSKVDFYCKLSDGDDPGTWCKRRRVHAIVRSTSLAAFCQSSPLWVVCEPVDHKLQESVLRRANGQLSKEHLGYSVITGNCEHFARWCHSGAYASSAQTLVNSKGLPWVVVGCQVLPAYLLCKEADLPSDVYLLSYLGLFAVVVLVSWFGTFSFCYGQRVASPLTRYASIYGHGICNSIDANGEGFESAAGRSKRLQWCVCGPVMLTVLAASGCVACLVHLAASCYQFSALAVFTAVITHAAMAGSGIVGAMTWFYWQLGYSTGRDELDYAIGALVLWFHAWRMDSGFNRSPSLPLHLGPLHLQNQSRE